MTTQLPKPPLVFYRTGPMPCPYLAGEVERNLFTELHGAGAPLTHDHLAKAGFRRSHHIVYRPACPGCSACVPVRVDAAAFRMSRSLRRIARRNEDLCVTVSSPVANDEHFDVFSAYQRDRHPGGEMATMTFADFRAMVEDTVVETELVEFRDPDGRLVGACLTDRLSDGLSAVYSYFDPADEARSLGTYMIVWLVRHARAARLRHVYLGYWIGNSAKMAYKTRFAPLEALGHDGWQRLSMD